MKNEKFTVGIDVSKDTLDVYYNTLDGKEVYLKVSNDAKGHEKLLKTIGRDHWYVMETSGPYYLRLAFFLNEHGVKVSAENALQVKRYIQMHNERNKTDRKDARWIWHYSQHRETKPWRVPSKEQIESQQLLKGLELLSRQKTMLSNQLHSLKVVPFQDKVLLKSISKLISQVEIQIKKLEQELDAKLKSWAPEELENLRSIPGLGKRATALLIVFTDGFKKVDNYRQLISLAGLSPKIFTSGTSVRGKVRICKMGGGSLRNILYMCSMSAIKCNLACKNLYERLRAKGKNGKVALIAVCNKLLKQAFAIAKSGTKYEAAYFSAAVK